MLYNPQKNPIMLQYMFSATHSVTGLLLKTEKPSSFKRTNTELFCGTNVLNTE